VSVGAGVDGAGVVGAGVVGAGVVGAGVVGAGVVGAGVVGAGVVGAGVVGAGVVGAGVVGLKVVGAAVVGARVVDGVWDETFLTKMKKMNENSTKPLIRSKRTSKSSFVLLQIHCTYFWLSWALVFYCLDGVFPFLPLVVVGW
jgi:hypothetical protein